MPINKQSSHQASIKIVWALIQENLTFLHANNKCADQPTLLGSLISTIVICYLESTNSQLAACKISIFYIIYVAEQAGLGLTWSETPKTGFLVSLSIW